VPNDPIYIPPNNRWGAAKKYQFDDPQKWVTVPSVPLLDEHEMSGADGRPVAQVDRSVLEEIARNNNKRVTDTGDPATLILGHTSDDPRAEERPAKGFVVNYQVKPFKRDESGRVIYAIHGDYKVRPQNAHLLEEYPRRSVELWWQKKELDPIAMLGGSSPERDLGVVIRNSRLRHVSMLGGTVPARDLGPVFRYARGGNPVLDYPIEVPMNGNGRPSRNGRGQPQRYNCDPKTGKPMQYADDGMDTDDFDGGDEAVPDDGDGGGDSAENDPTVAKVMQSKQMKDLFAKIDMIAQAVGVGADGAQDTGGVGGDDGMGMDEMPAPGPGGTDDGMGGGPGTDAPGGQLPMDDGMGMEPEEQDSRRGMGKKPVQMNAGGGPTGFPGPSNVNIPAFGKKPNQMSRNGQQRGTSVNATRQRSRTGEDPRDATIRRLRLKLARSEAERLVNDIEREGVIFSQDRTLADKIKLSRVEELTLAILHDEDSKDAGTPDTYVQDRVEEMRTCYQRRRPDPAAPQSVGLARYGRSVVPGTEGAEDEEFEPQSPQEASEMADLEYVKKMSRKEINAAMRKKYGRR
jgi:hypothetical protein